MEFVPPGPPPGVANRPVGPSVFDEADAENKNYIGFVYDYVTNKVDPTGKNVVVAGTPTDAPAKVYTYNDDQ